MIARVGNIAQEDALPVFLNICHAICCLHQQQIVLGNIDSSIIWLQHSTPKLQVLAQDIPTANIQDDIYALGRVLYEMLTGEAYCRKPDGRVRTVKISNHTRGMVQVLAKCFAREYQQIQDMIADVERYLTRFGNQDNGKRSAMAGEEAKQELRQYQELLQEVEKLKSNDQYASAMMILQEMQNKQWLHLVPDLQNVIEDITFYCRLAQ